MGALTFKPSAYSHRPWELSSLQVFNHFEGSGFINFHLRGTSLIKISGSGWLKDRVRFGYDGFRRQRLINPSFLGVNLNWSQLFSIWFKTCYRRNCKFAGIDGMMPSFAWLSRLYSFVQDGRGLNVFISVDDLKVCSVYHGVYGFSSFVDLPLCVPSLNVYEEDSTLRGPVNSASLNNWSVVTLQLLSDAELRSSFVLAADELTSANNLQRLFNNAYNKRVFQVSPIQRILTT